MYYGYIYTCVYVCIDGTACEGQGYCLNPAQLKYLQSTSSSSTLSYAYNSSTATATTASEVGPVWFGCVYKSPVDAQYVNKAVLPTTRC